MSGSLTGGGGENVPGISGACATHNITYLARGLWASPAGCLSTSPRHHQFWKSWSEALFGSQSAAHTMCVYHATLKSLCYAHRFVLLYSVLVTPFPNKIICFIYTYFGGLLPWHWNNLFIVPVRVKQPSKIWEKRSPLNHNNHKLGRYADVSFDVNADRHTITAWQRFRMNSL